MARLRFEWGPTGAGVVADGATYAVVVDVLSFTTTVTVAVERGVDVLPYRWRDAGAAAYAEEHDAALAVGRLEAREVPGAVSLSPAGMARLDPASGVSRVVLPSPNGSTIAHLLAGSGATVVAASLRNAGAVAAWLAARTGPDDVVAVVAAGERWPDGSLRPAVEDLWGAGAVLARLLEAGAGPEGPEVAAAARAHLAAGDLPSALRSCASGRELVEAGFAEDVEVAALLDVSDVVPVLVGDRFVAAP